MFQICAAAGGCKKILGIQYPDSGDNAKRTKYTAWRAAVETSGSVEQLALQVCLCYYYDYSIYVFRAIDIQLSRLMATICRILKQGFS